MASDELTEDGHPRRFLEVQTDLVGFCNLKCVMCNRSTSNIEDLRHLSRTQFRTIYDKIGPHLKSLGLSCGAEPTLAKDFLPIIEMVADAPDTFLVTNATVMNEAQSRAMVVHGLDKVSVSLDSHVPEVFEDIRPGASFAQVIANVRRLVALKREYGKDRPVLQFNCVLMRRNIEQVEEYLEFAKGLGVEEIDFRHMVVFEGSGMDEESLYHHKALANEYLGRARRKCAELGLHIYSMPGDFPPEPEPAPAVERAPEPAPAPPAARPVHQPGLSCDLPGRYMYIGLDGNVKPCAVWPNDEKPVGNLLTHSFDEMWNDPEYRALRDEVKHGIFRRDCCRNCSLLGRGTVAEEEAYQSRNI